MKLQNIFTADSTRETIERLSNLTPNTKPKWGEMNAPQMLAHLNVAYDIVITDERDFEKEKALFIENVKKTQELGASHFEGKKSPSFGKLTSAEWSNQFYKHMDHHFRQFGI